MNGLIDRMIPVLFAAGVAIVTLVIRAAMRGEFVDAADSPPRWAVAALLVLVGMASSFLA